jgi:N-acetylglutamate synthase/N-acetylornithine aminotransferase
LQVLTNAGQANAATGSHGMHDARDSQKHLAEALGCDPAEILVMSTGVIGRRIRLDKMRDAIPDLVASLGSEAKDAMRAAVAITTTGELCRCLLCCFVHMVINLLQERWSAVNDTSTLLLCIGTLVVAHCQAFLSELLIIVRWHLHWSMKQATTLRNSYAAPAIPMGYMCADLVSKSCALKFDLDGTTVTLGGIAKGSGMIHPNMATMLGLLTCDALVDPGVWSGMLKRAISRSFNAVCASCKSCTVHTLEWYYRSAVKRHKVQIIIQVGAG